jgi:hypothetical protein
METVVILRAEIQRLHGVRDAARARRAWGRQYHTAVSTLGPHSLGEVRVSGGRREASQAQSTLSKAQAGSQEKAPLGLFL